MVTYFIYKIIFLKGKKERYYIGKHKSHLEINRDKYAGSGKFCKIYYKKYGKIPGETYIREIIEINPSERENNLREKEIVGDLWKTDDLCMNQKPGGITEVTDKMTKSASKVMSDTMSVATNQYSLNGKFIKRWKSRHLAGKKLNIYPGSICDVCNRKAPCYAGFIWRNDGDIVSKEDIMACSVEELDKITKLTRAVKQYDLNGNLIKIHTSLSEAAKEMNGSFQNIQRCCNNSRQTAYGFKWEYVSNIIHKGHSNKPSSSKFAKQIDQYSLTGKFIKTWDSIQSAADAVGIKNPWAIKEVCRGNKYTSAGFIWRFTGDPVRKVELDRIKEIYNL